MRLSIEIPLSCSIRTLEEKKKGGLDMQIIIQLALIPGRRY